MFLILGSVKMLAPSSLLRGGKPQTGLRSFPLKGWVAHHLVGFDVSLPLVRWCQPQQAALFEVSRSGIASRFSACHEPRPHEGQLPEES